MARPALPTSSSAFALPLSNNNDDNQLLFRFRRPSLLAPKVSYLSDAGSRFASPLTSSPSLPHSYRHRRRGSESESDRERMLTDSSSQSSSSSGNPTPLTLTPRTNSEGEAGDANLPPSFRRSSNASMDDVPPSRLLARRFSHPVRSALIAPFPLVF
jgi:hypothetical protein